LKTYFHAVSVIHKVFSYNWAYRKKLQLGALIITLSITPLSVGYTSDTACLTIIEEIEGMEDVDGDGLYNVYEWDVFNTDPDRMDTDKDGTPDGEEDHDGDGITNWEHQLNEETPLIAAIHQGQNEKAMVILASGIQDPDAADARGRTALMAAAESGNIRMVEALLNYGADLNVVDSNGRTALRWALMGGHDEVVRLLKNSGARE
jgi:hypothetical protein